MTENLQPGYSDHVLASEPGRMNPAEEYPIDLEGSPQSEAPLVMQAAHWVCPVCGHDNTAESKFCPNCGLQRQ